MKSILYVLCVLGGFHSAFALDRTAFIFTDYNLQVKIIPATGSLEVHGKITLRNDTFQPQRNPVLQISSTLQWNSITVGGEVVQYLAQTYTSDIDHTGALSEAILTLPKPIPPQGSLEIDVAYSGTVPQDTTRLTRIGTPAGKATRSDWDQIGDSFVGVRGIGYVAWYPVATSAANLSEGNSFFEVVGAWKERESRSNLRASFCWTGGGQLIANDTPAGTTQARSAAGGNCRDLVYAPLGFTVPTFVLGNYRVLNQPPTTVDYLEGHELDARAWADAGEKVALVIAQWFGPRKQPVQVVQLPGSDYFPFESGTILFTPLRGREPQEMQLVLAHQLTHASFHSRRPWINEGAAHFAQALEREQQEGRKAALAYMDNQLPPLQQAEKAVPSGSGNSSTGQSLITSTDEVFYRTKAMFVWWMLRDMVGDDALGRAIREYRADHDNEPSYFQRLLAEQYHRNLEWFFDDWVYRDRGLPDFRITAVYPRNLLPQDWSVTVTVENLGTAGADVPVIVRAAQGEALKRLEIHSREKGMVVRIPIPATPEQAVVNDGSIPESNMENNTQPIKTQQASQ